MMGEFRVHYAGFFDPGFGHVEQAQGRQAPCWRCAATTCPSSWRTARPSDGWYTNISPTPPERLYGRDIGSNYQGQGLKLSKHFK